MAQQVLVRLVDDLDGTSEDGVATVTFGLDGVEYAIDLGTENAERLRKNLAQFVEAGRRTGGRLKRGTQPGGQSAVPGEASLIREWARENGFELANRGRIPSGVAEAYKSAQEAAKPKAKTRRPSARSKKA